MLYVDGMTGISQSTDVLQWLYSLISSKFRLVAKTALKLLLVFVEYSEYNASLLTKAIAAIDRRAGIGATRKFNALTEENTKFV